MWLYYIYGTRNELCPSPEFSLALFIGSDNVEASLPVTASSQVSLFRAIDI